MSVTDTSREAYHALLPTLGEKQQQVLDAISRAKRPVNNQEIADFLKKNISYVTPRTSELVKLDLVEVAFKATYPVTNRKVCYWRAKTN